MMAMFCSTNFTLLKVLGDTHSEAAVAAVRFAVALIPFLPLIPAHSSKSSIISGIEIGLWCTLGYVSQAVGLQTTEASTGAFLCSLAMVVVPVVKFIAGEQVRLQTWAAVALAATGTSFLVGLGGSGAGAPTMGDALCTLTAVGFGLMFYRMDAYAKEPGFDTLGCTIWQVLTLAATMSTWLLLQSGPTEALSQATSLLTGGAEVLMPLLWVGVVTTAGVLYIETWCMERMDSAEAGVIFASEPVWATLFASQVLGERFGMSEGIGSALIVTACLLTQVGDGEAETETASEEADKQEEKSRTAQVPLGQS
jgi:drug/metabolite transporter (DMT)-like permease